MNSGVWTSVYCMALLIGGCPKRQSGPRLVYVPAPPPATSAAPAPDSGTLVIEEPVPPETEEVKLPNEAPPPTPPTPTRPPRAHRTGIPTEPTLPEPGTDEPSSVEPPALEPARGAGQAGLRQRIETTQQGLASRLAQFERRPLSDAERRTLAEGRAFLDQSMSAMKEGDLQRAERLVYKADLLITAFEQRH